MAGIYSPAFIPTPAQLYKDTALRKSKTKMKIQPGKQAPAKFPNNYLTNPQALQYNTLRADGGR